MNNFLQASTECATESTKMKMIKAVLTACFLMASGTQSALANEGNGFTNKHGQGTSQGLPNRNGWIKIKGGGKDKIRKYRFIQNSSNSNCAFMGIVGVEVQYKFKSADMGTIVLSGSSDSSFQDLAYKDVEKGRGTVTMAFDAGDCMQDVNLNIE